MALSIRQLKYFIATAEYGQVSQAAVNQNISQSAITAAIKDLESSVGVPLFSRTTQGMELTASGRQFLSHAYEILSKIDEAMHLNFIDSDIQGELVVAATYTVIGYFLPLHIERMRRLFPKIRVQLYEMNRDAIEEGLLTNRYDMSVLLTSNIMNPLITTETLVGSVRRLWVPAQHHLLKYDAVGLQEVAQEPYIMLTVDEAAQSALKYWSKTPYQPNVILRTSSVEAVRSMVANNQGVAILSDMVHRPWSLEGRRIETITVQDQIPAMDIGLGWRAGRALTPAMQAFRSYFQQAFGTPGAPSTKPARSSPSLGGSD
ncbi:MULTISPECIES: LysR family transcriptional regulator [Rhizobium]|uniref:LysR family transcriptional regulator n=1 Tax=Rhizobium TaxID=379 RepID=UPI000A1FB9F8|nr:MULTISPECIES: LysR family transcriptional regulator [Rhizobium]ARM90909.1 LysR family transcriptional regulator protein [Rhizobium sp. CIAT894]MBB4299496.1 DNA-binding transcriptional LysR family regulator [Rhizobium leguminosarum]MBB4310934.1 DNA-binding transcriptional LysR family regulator [Rhizobium leguminosarum]MBB4435050.1 DNA-binding transcriptional LysR family regulator [Rhizobium esperanzae]MBB4532018.1 DNA-binding transcriptional LysR family regulator [Rhizobium leguminosarum]